MRPDFDERLNLGADLVRLYAHERKTAGSAVIEDGVGGKQGHRGTHVAAIDRLKPTAVGGNVTGRLCLGPGASQRGSSEETSQDQHCRESRYSKANNTLCRVHSNTPRVNRALSASYRTKTAAGRLNCFAPLPALPSAAQPDPVMSFMRTTRLFPASAT